MTLESKISKTHFTFYPQVYIWPLSYHYPMLFKLTVTVTEIEKQLKNMIQWTEKN